ncbi:phospholipase A-2-activating protein [Artomyces pyxidatus]|uniref:Phospholipase A-2-activating protein n=1 Tax=Artomyces pyxidatus TaxID=48021 RepID=A0ACB8T3H8_9AGAM|nr:phospholipase A-2-activating protein [Artomyces pyxidatus]
MSFKLSATLLSHSADVKAVASPTNDLILSASRDATTISWIKSDSRSFSPAATFRAGSRYVNSVAYLPPTPEAPHGYAVTGGQDAIINVWILGSSSSEPSYTLVGHADNVCALYTKPDGTIVSGSWDKTAKVWKNFSQASDLVGHAQSVWTVLAAEGDEYLTGSADKTIKLWRQNKCLRTYHGHKDAVRSLALLTDIGFASASNDSEIIIWTFEGDVVHSLSAHTSFVYSLALLPSGDIVSGGEDRSLRIWRDGECSQTIVHPAISVWSVSVMPNGDIVTGASDGSVRVFSEVEERWAPADELKAFDDQVASQALPSQQIGDVKKSDLPGLDALFVPGHKPDEVKMVRNGALVEAHQWDSASGKWQKIGEVVDAVGPGRKQLHEGKEYDYVFDVDIQDGVPPLKLPYNVTENPYAAAQRFLESNELPMSYLDQVVQFIEKNTAGVNIGTGGDEYVDPYTGASRYRGSGTSAPAAASAYSDPFTGASRYISSNPTTPSAPAATYSDPFTGSARYVAGAPPSTSKPSAPQPSVIPVSKTLSFRQANVSAMQGKLYQFDQALRSEISTSALAMYPDEVGQLEEAFTFLSQSIAGMAPSPPLTHSHIETVVNILDRWPASQRFPVLDLARLISGFCSELVDSAGYRTIFFDALIKASELTQDGTLPSSKAKETNVLLALRTIANAFQEKTTLGDGAWAKKILSILGEAPYPAFTKAQRLALSTVLFNFSCIALHERVEASLRALHLRIIDQVLRTERGDAEVVYRALVGLGNVLYAAKNQEYPLEAAQLSEVRDSVAPLPSAFPDGRINGVAGEVLALI